MPKRRNLVSQRQALLQQKRGKNDQKNLRRKIEKVSISHTFFDKQLFLESVFRSIFVLTFCVCVLWQKKFRAIGAHKCWRYRLKGPFY